MTNRIYLALLISAILQFAPDVNAQTQPAETKSASASSELDSVKPELTALVGKVRAKIQAGQTAETNFTAELKKFDDIIAKNPKADPEALAQVAAMKATLYLQVFDDTEKGTELLMKIKTDYPNTKIASHVDAMLEQIAKQAEAKKIQAALKPGAVFPDFDVKDLDGKPLSVAALKGKVVMIDFWATWCPPCRAELPNVIDTFKKYHSKGFEIIGVSLDSDKDKLESFLKEQDGMAWPQFFDGKGWSNELALQYGVEAIPFTVLIGSDGKIIGTDLRGEALGEAVGKALARN